MANQIQRCPNCGASNSVDMRQCVICGARLVGASRRSALQLPTPPAPFDPHEGEDDLMVRSMMSTPLSLGVGFIIVVVLIVVGVGLFLWFDEDESTDAQVQSPIGSAQPTNTATQTPIPTNTRPAPRLFPTITPLPATATPTPTEGPCIKRAAEGDTLYGLALQCGHRHYSIVEVIVQENDNVACETCLSVGQEIMIPWPTPLPGTEGAAVPSGGGSDVEVSGGQTVNQFGTPDSLATLYVEPTLRPGLMWHRISAGETMGSVAIQYNADAKVLSDINPELEFQQCDFSMRFGGEECRVMLTEGQRIRVPAPTGTPTLSPTPSGSETPTPTYTPTFNVPSVFSPADRAEFDATSMITLRWSASGTLGENERYLVRMMNLDTNEEYRDSTEELFFVVPDEWQPDDGRQEEFEWTISIAVMDGVLVLTERATTEPRRFLWGGR